MNEWMECMWCNNTELDCTIIRTPSPYCGVALTCVECVKKENRHRNGAPKIPLKEDYDKANGIPTDTFIV
jgi:hypothetical protein